MLDFELYTFILVIQLLVKPTAKQKLCFVLKSSKDMYTLSIALTIELQIFTHTCIFDTRSEMLTLTL